MTGGRDGSGCMEELPLGGAREGKQQHPGPWAETQEREITA